MNKVTTALHSTATQSADAESSHPVLSLQEIGEFFKCLSEPVRLRILHLLLVNGELCVCDLVDGLGLSQSVVSRHLAYMRNNNLLNTRREGVWVHYQLASPLAPMADSVLQAFKKAAADSEDLCRDLEKVGSASCC